MSYLAHSARPEKGIPAQDYDEHVNKTRQHALENAEGAGRYSPKYGSLLKVSAALAGEFHDMGKLDEENQRVLSGKVAAKKLPVQHVDAGVSHLLALGKQWHQLAAFISYAHHIGLPSLPKEENKGNAFLRDPKMVSYTLERLSEYLRKHREDVEKFHFDFPNSTLLDKPQLFFRMALSCLVDADHGDTARHYGKSTTKEAELLQPLKRLKALNQYVENLGEDDDTNNDRNRIRQCVYEACRNAETTPAMYACDSPVGTGKTTAIMSHLLKAAHDKGLRRIFVVLPYINIIKQSVDVYRKSLRLDGEVSEEIVAAHHHRADFQDPDTRQFTLLWRSPIVVTTAVQFFETLASNHPATLRKLHHLSGAAVFFDEAHAALPAHLWPQAWRWLRELSDEWGCHFVFGSGSLNRFWELPDFVEPPVKIPELVKPEIRISLATKESTRIIYKRKPDPLDLKRLIAWLDKLEGPRLLIVNTVQSAAAIAKEIAEKQGSDKVEHISTALSPIDREQTLDRIKDRLSQCKPPMKNKALADWTLVATSCVEAGVDLSFKTGLRESASLVSLLQISGRVNRHQEYGCSDVWSFTLQASNLLRRHPDFKNSSKVLDQMFDENRVTPESCKEALRREICLDILKDEIRKHEDAKDFPEVCALFRVINADTYTAVVDENTKQRLRAGEKVHSRDIQAHSVQIWGNKLQLLKIPEFVRYPGLYEWNLEYDDFIGYMLGVLKNIEFNANGGAII